MKLGKRPARPDAVKLKLASYLDTAAFPKVPKTFGHEQAISDFGMLGNDQYGNCLVEGTQVSAPDVEGAFRTAYFGTLVTITLASGKRLTVTPKHSVLTAQGFTSADSVKQGDYLIGTSRTQILPGTPALQGQIDINNRPTPIEKVFTAIGVTGNSPRKLMNVAVDFNGDEKFFDGDVQVVRANRFLRNQSDPSLHEPQSKDQIRSTRQLQSVLIGDCSPFLSHGRGRFAAHGSVGVLGDRFPLADTQAGISQPERLGLGAELVPCGNDGFLEEASRHSRKRVGISERRSVDVHLDSFADISVSSLGIDPPNLGVCSIRPKASIFHPTSKSGPTDPHIVSDLNEAFPGLIAPDYVVSVDVQRNVRTHVYDLSTASRWYLANGIITHNCVWAGAAHETMIWNKECGKDVLFTPESILSDYSAVTGFNPNDPNTDQGTDMQAAASYRQKTGILDANGTRHKIGAYLAITPGNVKEHLLAAYLFGAVGIGIKFPGSAMDQFNAGKPWRIVKGAKIDGGHYIPFVAKRKYPVIVTWGKAIGMTEGFFKRYNDESIAYVSEEMLTGGKSPEGFDLATLLADLKAIRNA